MLMRLSLTLAPEEKSQKESLPKPGRYYVWTVIKIKCFSECAETQNFDFYPSALGIKHIAEGTPTLAMYGFASNILVRMFTGHTWWFGTENKDIYPANRMIFIYLGFWEAFDTVSHSIYLENWLLKGWIVGHFAV